MGFVVCQIWLRQFRLGRDGKGAEAKTMPPGVKIFDLCKAFWACSGVSRLALSAPLWAHANSGALRDIMGS